MLSSSLATDHSANGPKISKICFAVKLDKMRPLPAEIFRDPLHHSLRGTRQGGAFGPQAPIPGGYGATDPEKSLQEVGPLYPV